MKLAEQYLNLCEDKDALRELNKLSPVKFDSDGDSDEVEISGNYSLGGHGHAVFSSDASLKKIGDDKYKLTGTLTVNSYIGSHVVNSEDVRMNYSGALKKIAGNLESDIKKAATKGNKEIKKTDKADLS